MEQIDFKPNLKIEKFFLIIEVLIAILIIIIAGIYGGNVLFASIFFLIFLGAVAIVTLAIAIPKTFTKYSITNDNKIIVDYKFITSSKKIYRLDQVTSISLSQGLLGKIFGLANINFGIFGGTSFNPNSTKQGQSYQSLLPKFQTIKDYKKIFNILAQNISLDLNSKIIYEDEPSTKPSVFGFSIFFIFEFISITLLIVGLMNTNTKEKFIMLITGTIGVAIFFIPTITSFFHLLKVKSTKYTIRQDRIVYEDDYMLSATKIIVPNTKITNSQINKNLITYGLFKVGSVKLFTGGSKDPKFASLEDFEGFANVLSKIYSNINNQNQETNNIDYSTNIHTKEESAFKTKPSASFFVTFWFYSTIILLIPTAALLVAKNFIIIEKIIYYAILTGIGILYISLLLLRFILWKNTTYDFSHYKLISKSGILNITTKEIHFNNIKHIELHRKLLFDRAFGQGTIYIFTPGTASTDAKLSSIKEYKDVYEELKEVLGRQKK